MNKPASRSLYLWLLLLTNNVLATELIIGEKIIEPGIVIVFEGAIKDDVIPYDQNLAVKQTDVHLEARVNWTIDETRPRGAPLGGFIPYMQINAQVTNQTTKQTTFVSLIPHINLVDNFHYARNMALPGKINEKYTVAFFIEPPNTHSLAFHKDWQEQYGDQLFKPATVTFNNIDFERIAQATREKKNQK